MSVAVAERKPEMKKTRAKRAPMMATMARREPLTENGMVLAEEREILRIVERMHRGEEKMYSAEEVWKKLGLGD